MLQISSNSGLLLRNLKQPDTYRCGADVQGLQEVEASERTLKEILQHSGPHIKHHTVAVHYWSTLKVKKKKSKIKLKSSLSTDETNSTHHTNSDRSRVCPHSGKNNKQPLLFFYLHSFYWSFIDNVWYLTKNYNTHNDVKNETRRDSPNVINKVGN